jgi:hypothetical protein
MQRMAHEDMDGASRRLGQVSSREDKFLVSGNECRDTSVRYMECALRYCASGAWCFVSDMCSRFMPIWPTRGDGVFIQRETWRSLMF